LCIRVCASFLVMCTFYFETGNVWEWKYRSSLISYEAMPHNPYFERQWCTNITFNVWLFNVNGNGNVTKTSIVVSIAFRRTNYIFWSEEDAKLSKKAWKMFLSQQISEQNKKFSWSLFHTLVRLEWSNKSHDTVPLKVDGNKKWGGSGRT
jgi:hypothetical protein